LAGYLTRPESAEIKIGPLKLEVSVEWLDASGQSHTATIQLGSSALVLVALVGSALLLRSEASYLVTVVSSQLLSPILWDHYAMLLLLPVAWLLARRQWWAVLIPLLTSVVALFVGMPAVLYPIAFWAALLGVLGVGWRERGQEHRLVAA